MAETMGLGDFGETFEVSKLCEILYSVKPILGLRMIKLEVENLVTLSLKKHLSQRRSRKKTSVTTGTIQSVSLPEYTPQDTPDENATPLRFKTPLAGMQHPSASKHPWRECYTPPIQNSPVCNDTPLQSKTPLSAMIHPSNPKHPCLQ